MELFELYLAPGEASHQFKVTVSQSPVGEGSTESLLPFFEGDYDWRTTLLKTMESTTFNPDNFQIPNEQAWMINVGLLTADLQSLHPNWLKTVGRSLYQALFPQDSVVKQRLQSALNFAESKDIRLHIRLKFDANSTQRSRLADYPWELIHDGQRFLAQHQVTFSRYIAHDTVPPNLPATKQVTVLLISSSASDAEQGLKFISTTEQQAIRQGLEKATQAGDIHLVQLERSTLRHLRVYLTEHTGDVCPQVLHFDGHGLFGKRCVNEQCRAIHKGVKVERCRICGTLLPDAQGYLVFEREEGGPDYVSAAELGALLQQTSFADTPHASSRIALTVLSSCQSGMSVIGDSLLNGIAQNLISHRVPAVVAMQYSVSIQSAAHFAEQFYRSLGQKRSLAIAVSQGREAMGAEGNQWYRPVLYLRWRDNAGGQLFAQSSPSISSRLSLQQVLVTSLFVTVAIFGFRFFKISETLELKAFDQLMQLRLDEGPDSRILIVQITDDDLRDQIEQNTNEQVKEGDGTLSDKTLRQLLEKLKEHHATIIGYDLLRDFQTKPDLVPYFKSDGFVGICFNKARAATEIHESNIGFSSFVPDDDQVIRRYLIAQERIPGKPCQAEQSFSFVLVRRYLELKNKSNYGYTFPSNQNFKLNGFVFPPLQPFTGAYTDVDSSGYQILLNYRSREGGVEKVATSLTVGDVLHDREVPDLRDKIVLIGLNAPNSRNDEFMTPYGLTQGIFIHAHMVSQVLNFVEGRRSLIKTWSKKYEFFWILGWSTLGGFLALYFRSLLYLSMAGATATLLLCGLCLVFLAWWSLWLPLVPAFLSLFLTSSIVSIECWRRHLFINPKSKS